MTYSRFERLIALFSYAGRLHWGFNADWDALPDLHGLVQAVEHELATFQDLGRGEAASPMPA